MAQGLTFPRVLWKAPHPKPESRNQLEVLAHMSYSFIEATFFFTEGPLCPGLGVQLEEWGMLSMKGEVAQRKETPGLRAGPALTQCQGR